MPPSDVPAVADRDGPPRRPGPSERLPHDGPATGRAPSPAIGGVPLAEIADRFGTPACVLDEDEVRRRCRVFRDALPDGGVLYEADALWCRAVAHWVREEGLGLAVRSAEELEFAVVDGLPPEHIVLHGIPRHPEHLAAALRLGVGRIIIDSASATARLAAAVPAGSRRRVLLRVSPGIVTGGRTPGLSLNDATAHHAIVRILDQPRLELAGLHADLGARTATARTWVSAVRNIIGFLARVRHRHATAFHELHLGGPGLARTPGEDAADSGGIAHMLRTALIRSCAAAGMTVPRLTIGVGSAVVGPAAVALHRVLSVERTAARTFTVAVDGGVRDGLRYGAESGGPLLGDPRPGDVVALPVFDTHPVPAVPGRALVCRLPVVAVSGGRARLLVRRETLADVHSRDISL